MRRSRCRAIGIAHNNSFDRAAGWLYEGMAKAFGANTARLAIVGDNPMLLSGEDPTKVARASKANSMAYQPALEKIVNFETNWNIIAYPSPAWAKQVFPDVPEDVAVAKLADAIFAASRVDQDGAVANWEQAQCGAARAHRLAQRAALPRAEIFRSGHRSHHWTWPTAMNGKAALRPPRTASPATPIFRPRKSSPRRIAGASAGMSSRSKPLSYQGTLIDNIAVRFEEGRIVEAKASRGEEVLKKVLDTDEGARAPRRSGAGAAFLADLEKRAVVLQHAVRRERGVCTSRSASATRSASSTAAT